MYVACCDDINLSGSSLWIGLQGGRLVYSKLRVERMNAKRAGQRAKRAADEANAEKEPTK